METVTTIEQIKEFIQQTNQSGKRSRRLVYFISFASIISFMLLCSTSHVSWSRLRYQKAIEVEQAIDSEQSRVTNTIVFKTPKDRENYQPFLDARREEIVNYDGFKAYKEKLKGNNISFSLPFFNVNVDVNYLAIYSGLILSFLLFVLWLNLAREKSNLEITFSTIRKLDTKEGDLKRYFYHLLATGQMLTIPKHDEKMSIPYQPKVIRLWSFALVLLYFSPVITQTFILIEDISTAARGASVNGLMTGLTIGFSSVFWLCIVVLCYACWRSVKKIDALWTLFHTGIFVATQKIEPN
jgi:hypothetical protein